DVRLVGSLDGDVLRALCHRADALAHAATAVPRKAEGFGLVIAEAAACGLPTVATRIDAIPEVARDEVNAILVDDGDVASLSRALARIAEDPALRARLSEGALQVAAGCDWSVAAAAVANDPPPR
ncbi:MAG: glycosyltransferase family 4 protein, partial [Caulobacter sp.]